MKACSKCEVVSASYYKDGRATDGLQSQCKACMKAGFRRGYVENREAILTRRKANYAANSQPTIDRAKAYYRANRDSVLAKVKQYRDSRPEVITERRRLAYLRDAHVYAAKYRVCYAADPTKFKARAALRRVLLQNAGTSYTSDDIRDLFTKQKGKCACCVRKLGNYEIDHITPLSKGGSNERRNLQLLCRYCNRSKHAKHPITFMQSRGFLL